MSPMRVRLVRHMQDRSTEWLSALVMIAWGVTLALPGDTLAGASFSAFRRFGMDETSWSLVFFGAGCTRVAALWINGRWPRTPTIRMALAAFGALSWVQVSLLLYQSSVEHMAPLGTGPGVYGILALYDLIAVFRASVDVRYYESR